LMGGAIISLDIAGLSWRPAFLALVPIGCVALAAAALLLDNTRGKVAARLDGAGTLGLGAALALFILPLMAGRDAGWPAWMLVALIASVPECHGVGLFATVNGAGLPTRSSTRPAQSSPAGAGVMSRWRDTTVGRGSTAGRGRDRSSC